MVHRALLILTLLCSGHLQAQSADDDALGERFRALDADGNGVLTVEELPSPSLFRRLDADADGAVSFEEVRDGPRGLLPPVPQAPRPPAPPSRPLRPGPPTPPVPPPAPLPTPSPGMQRHLDIPYARMEGVDPGLLSLDLYAPATGQGYPVLVMVHGGGWRGGDKASAGVAALKSEHFVGAGYVFVSVNYRLSPAVLHPAHVEDLAQALIWVRDHVARHGGDPRRIHLMGHSAGAHLAALVATDHRRLQALGGDLALLRGVILLDSAAYDLPGRMGSEATGPVMRGMYEAAFGTDPAVWLDASPLHHVAPGKAIPPFLLFHTANRMLAAVQTQGMVEALQAAGVEARAVYTPDRTHGSLNREIGTAGDHVTADIMAFLGRCTPRPSHRSAAVGALLRQHDRDGNGCISTAEAPLRLRRRFARLDLDGDGQLSPAELDRVLGREGER